MSVTVGEGEVSVRLVESSPDVVSAGRGWTVNRWVVADITDSSGTYPSMRVRAEVIKSGKQSKAAITELQIGKQGKATLPRQINALGRLMPQLPAELLALVAFPEPDVPPNVDDFIQAMKVMLRTPNLTQFEREDEVLHRWETEFEPKGDTQKDLAVAMGLSHETVRKYLMNARGRRNSHG